MKLQLNIFEGPLDLLLYLIKKEHIDIYDIPIVQVVDQYLTFLEVMKNLDIKIASEYLLLAAELINIKSKMLLPKDPQVQEEDPRQDLVNRLVEYEKFKGIASFLRDKEEERRQYSTRINPIDLSDKEVYLEVSIVALISAFKNALKNISANNPLQVFKDEYTVEDKIHYLLHLIVVNDKLSLVDLFTSCKNKMEIVVTFLAILELIKMREISAVQEDLFKPIFIIKRENILISSADKENINTNLV